MAGQSFSLKMLLKFMFLASLSTTVYSSDVRGVGTSKLSFYNPQQDFACLDGTVTVPFSYVNDDYCDCPDGSDEPGTAACPNGSFTCKNLGHKQVLMQSNRVNDGVCDCCDGSDEYDSDGACQNTCDEVGRAERERVEQERNFAQQGFLVKAEYINESKQKRQEIETKNGDSKNHLEELKTKLEELKGAKERAEALEKEAKEKQDKEWDEIQKTKQAEEESKKIDEAFEKLDIDGNGLINIHEIISSSYIVKELTEDQVREKLGGENEIDRLKLHDLWSTFKDLYNDSEKTPSEKPEETKEEPLAPPETNKDKEREEESLETKATDFPDPNEDDDEDGGEDSDPADEDADEPRSPPRIKLPEPGKPEDEASKDHGKPDYDGETKRLISIADQARKQFEEIESQVKNTENDITNNDKVLGIEFGDDHEFLSLHGKCFEYTDREYVYRLCPFDSATQLSKGGGHSDTSLGTWGEWHGSPNKYSKMKYSDGLSCWNGPNRSTDVTLSCGAKNEIISVSEPNKCEYVMEFKTPALCQDPAALPRMSHEEL